jgi:hypothetical protein
MNLSGAMNLGGTLRRRSSGRRSFRHRLAERSRFCQRSCSSTQPDLSRPMVVADRPTASGPRSEPSASSKSPVEMPFK